MSRRNYSDEKWLMALAIGAEHGPGAAERRTGVPQNSVKSKLRRGVDPAELEAGKALLAAEKGGVDLEALQRDTEAAYRVALAAGNTLGVQRLSVAIGVIERNLGERAQRETTRPAVDLSGPAGAQRLARIAARFVELAELAQLRSLRMADDRELDEAMRVRYACARRLHVENRWIAEQRRRLRAGQPSMFGNVQLPTSSSVRIPPRITRPPGVTREQRDPVKVAEHFDGKVEEGRRARVIPLRWGRSVQEDFLERQGVDPGLFKPPRGA